MQTFLNITPEQKSGRVFTNEIGLELRLNNCGKMNLKGELVNQETKDRTKRSVL